MQVYDRIKKIREEKGLKLIDLYNRIAEQFGPRAIDYSTLKRIQSGKTKPTDFSLYRISMGLGIPLKDLKEDENAVVKFIPCDKPEGRYDYTPVKAHADKLANRKLKGFLPQRLVLSAGAKTRIEKDPENTTEVIYQKWVYGLKGEITCVVNEERFILKRGDTCFFESHHPHYFENNSSKTSTCLVIQSPPYW
jgi:mannose-6-phosphate isomerase-like protein (cupin superfamily)